MLVSIIIPFYNNWQLTHARMMELHTYLHEPCEIVLVNDASTDTEIDGGVAFWQKHSQTKHQIRYIVNKDNLGFGGSMNKGINRSTGDIIVLLSNDVLIKSDFVTEVVTLLQENNKYFIGGEVLWHDTGWNVIDKTIIPYANGWFLAFTRDTWKNLDGFDPIYNKFDYEDVDLSLQAVTRGYILKGLTESNLHHLGGQTVRKYNPDREKYTLENQKKFIEKWKDKI